ncbi:hypothetical protein LCGC14_1968930 [marine sediment metagenome]|uniref:HTH arsR-type domain-containing protein n=1 Tax=marine sediment metagenome TaxID=412755 RepID=A0A0F9HQT3_9ZZZZ
MLEDWNENIPYKTKLKYYILNVLGEQEYCTWKRFLKEIIIYLHKDSLPNDLAVLLEKGYIEKKLDNHLYRYYITTEGQEYKSQIVKVLRKSVEYPSSKLNLSIDEKIIYTLQNSSFLFISNLESKKLGINNSTLYKHLRKLIDKGLIEKIRFPGFDKSIYRFTFLGRTRAFEMIKVEKNGKR